MAPSQHNLQASSNALSGIRNPPRRPPQPGHAKPTLFPSSPPQSKTFSLPQAHGVAHDYRGTRAFTSNDCNNNNTNTAYAHVNHDSFHTPNLPAGSIVSSLLSYCTTEPPLSTTQAIALSDVVGSLRELVLLTLAAASGDTESMDILEGALGRQDAASVVEFFEGEWEIEG